MAIKLIHPDLWGTYVETPEELAEIEATSDAYWSAASVQKRMQTLTDDFNREKREELRKRLQRALDGQSQVGREARAAGGVSHSKGANQAPLSWVMSSRMGDVLSLWRSISNHTIATKPDR